jgi:hypothetical protein
MACDYLALPASCTSPLELAPDIGRERRNPFVLKAQMCVKSWTDVLGDDMSGSIPSADDFDAAFRDSSRAEMDKMVMEDDVVKYLLDQMYNE